MTKTQPAAKTNTRHKRFATAGSVEKSPFFYPSDPRLPKKQVIGTAPGGTATIVQTPNQQIDDEHKTGILGTSANLVVSILGAGFVGIPYALKQSGLVSGLIMTIVSAVLVDKSLTLLIETAKHVDVTSYETLFEAAFGDRGFKGMCGIMFVMSYGAMVSYLMIIKDMLSMVLGVDPDDWPKRQAVMVISTLLVALPLSSQRDMADLSKTSRLSVVCYLCIVLFIAICSPVMPSVRSNGGLEHTITETMIRPTTFFVGFGVLTFAFVCQHSAFILAGSLERPTKARWAKVVHVSLGFSGTMAVICGVAGFLAFLEKTDGNILVNMDTIQSQWVERLNQVARAMLLTCMFFVYPMDAFVLRHVSMVLLFKGRAAHDGIDHLVLARRDRRILLTFALYLLTLLPALFLTNLGTVLSVTGSVAASSLCYICPGASYLAVHGGEFKKLVNMKWSWGNPDRKASIIRELKSGEDVTINQSCGTQIIQKVQTLLGLVAWYLCLMPVWMAIAECGQRNLLDYAEKEATKSPAPVKRLGKITHKRVLSDRAMGLHTPDFLELSRGIIGDVTERSPLIRFDLDAHQLVPPKKTYSIPDNLDSAAGGADVIEYQDNPLRENRQSVVKSTASVDVNRAIGAAIASANAAASAQESCEEEDDPQSSFPKVQDFCLAAGFITLGVVAMVAGLYSVFVPVNN